MSTKRERGKETYFLVSRVRMVMGYVRGKRRQRSKDRDEGTQGNDSEEGAEEESGSVS